MRKERKTYWLRQDKEGNDPERAGVGSADACDCQQELQQAIDQSSSSDVPQRLVWLSVRLFLAGGSIPVGGCTFTARLSCTHRFSFSQVLENARRQSVEGLALPFLTNWLLGMIDILVYL